jgi:hypothetical protein
MFSPIPHLGVGEGPAALHFWNILLERRGSATAIIMMARCEWRPLETAPRDGTAVLLFNPDWDTLRVGIRYGEASSWQQPNGDLLPEPARWMMLPSGPSEESGPE